MSHLEGTQQEKPSQTALVRTAWAAGDKSPTETQLRTKGQYWLRLPNRNGGNTPQARLIQVLSEIVEHFNFFLSFVLHCFLIFSSNYHDEEKKVMSLNTPGLFWSCLTNPKEREKKS